MKYQADSIIDPPIDDLLESADSKYSLVTVAAKRARQINAHYSQLHEGLLEFVAPLVETKPHEKPLSIALREIIDKQIVAKPAEVAAASEPNSGEGAGESHLAGEGDSEVAAVGEAASGEGDETGA